MRMLRKRNHRKASEWDTYQHNFSDLLQHTNGKKHQKLNNVVLETNLSQQIEDVDSQETNNYTAGCKGINDETLNSQLIVEDVAMSISEKTVEKIETNNMESTSLQDSVDLFSSPVSVNPSPKYVSLLHKSDFTTPHGTGNFFSSPIGESVTPKRNSRIFSSSVIKYCTPKQSFSSLTCVDSANTHSLHKSTPSGSPILEKSRKMDGEHRRTLIPLSPITPGVNWNNFTSAFSVHGYETTLANQTEDQTTLATPLDVTDDEIDEYTQENKIPQRNDEFEISEQDFESQKPQLKPKDVLDTTGSKWIKNVQDKIDEDWKKKVTKLAEKSSFQEDTSVYDSGKKLKLKKGGFADKLSNVIKREQSQKSVFLQKLNTKKLKKEDSLFLKVLSDVKEGLLRIIECKVIDVNEKSLSSSFTLILPDDFADNLEVSLGTNIRVYPPFQKVEIRPLNTTVLLSAYNIICRDSSSGNSLHDSANDNSTQSQHSQRFESLLNCLEAQMGCDESINIVATVQRIFCQLNTVEKWSMLCIDAYGTIFLIDAQNFSCNSSQITLLTSGEGQRVIFKNLFLKDRLTRSRFPSLFSVVDSVWNFSGEGFLHSVGSESQHSAEFVPLQPPSYCYLLCTDDTSEVDFPTNEIDMVCERTHCETKLCQVASELNRPRNDKNKQFCDVLYAPPKICRLTDTLDEKFDTQGRFSIICQYSDAKTMTAYESQCSEDIYCSQHNDSDVTLTVREYLENASESESKYQVNAKSSCLLPHNMSDESILVFKDLCIVSNNIVADQFTRVASVDCICEANKFLSHRPAE